MSEWFRRVAWVAVLVVLALGVSRAALSRFREKQQAMYKACREEAQKLGLSKAALKTKYPTPEIHMVTAACLRPGATGEVVIKGKFAPGTTFVFENDNLEVVKQSLMAGEYRATLKAPAGAGPQTAAVAAISPVSCITARHERAAAVTGRFEWTMNANNGWKVVARSAAEMACAGSEQEAYEVQFFHGSEAAPFARRKATLSYSVYERTNYRFNIDQQDPAAQPGVQNYTELAKRLADPKLTDAQRDQLMKQMEKAMAQMQADVKRATDPAYIKEQQAKREQFGCEAIQLQEQGGALTGDMRCAQAVGNRIALTGTMRAIAR